MSDKLKMKDVISSGYKNYNHVTFSWTVNNVCQYRCTYCYAADMLRKKFEDKYRYVYKNIIKQLSLKRLPEFTVEMLGGEPTLHPDICDILKQLNSLDKCKTVELVTNLVKPLEFFEQFDTAEHCKLNINASYHPEYDKNGTYIDKCIQLNKSKYISIIGNINLYKDATLWPKIADTITTLTNARVPTTLNWLHDVEGRYETEYTKEFYDTFSQFMDDTNTLTIAQDHNECVRSKNVLHRNVPYVTHQGAQSLCERDIKRYNLDRFKGFNCTPLMWTIDLDGAIINACTHEPLNVLATNIDKRVKCPVANGCACEVMYSYYKHLDE